MKKYKRIGQNSSNFLDNLDRLNLPLEIKTLIENNKILEGEVLYKIRDGFIVSLFNDKIRAFLPGSQVKIKHKPSGDYIIGSSLMVKVVDISKNIERDSSLIVSHRIILEEQIEALKKEFWLNVEIGKEYVGVVSNMVEFGVFITVQGAQNGLLHISQIPAMGKKINEIFEINQEVKVKISNLDLDNKKVWFKM